MRRVYRETGVPPTDTQGGPDYEYVVRTGGQGPAGPRGSAGPRGPQGGLGATGATGQRGFQTLLPSGGSLAAQLTSPSPGDRYFLATGPWTLGDLTISESDIALFADNGATFTAGIGERILISGDRNLLFGLVLDDNAGGATYDHMIHITGEDNELSHCGFTFSVGGSRLYSVLIENAYGADVHDCDFQSYLSAANLTGVVWVNNVAGGGRPVRIHHNHLNPPAAGASWATRKICVKVEAGECYIECNSFDVWHAAYTVCVEPVSGTVICYNEFIGHGGTSNQVGIACTVSLSDVLVIGNMGDPTPDVFFQIRVGIIGSRCRISGNVVVGDLVSQGDFVTACLQDSVIDSNIGLDLLNGVVLTNGACQRNVISNNVFVNSSFEGTYGIAIYRHDATSRDNVIQGNVVDNFQYGVIIIQNTYKTTITGNSLVNVRNGIYIRANAGHRADNETTIVGNVVCGASSSAVAGIRISIDGIEGFVVRSNVARENWPANKGIWIEANADHYIVENNVVNGLTNTPGAAATRIVADNIDY